MEKSATEEVSIEKITIKKEVINDDIKEFAETAMNELLGWYGYGNNHRDRRTCKSHSGSNSSEPESPKYNEGCGWCGKPVDESTALSSAAATFCSELCFAQSRRATFKKNKTCDWCRHVRHAVSYVDSQDGSTQLQFCSDKCLNQYKMHIFWRETRAHLEIHPHIHSEESSGNLITPDLWLTKCKSPARRSPSPSISPKIIDSPQTSPLPLITVTHPSKLMSNLHEEQEKRQRNRVQKKNRKKSMSIPSSTSTRSSLPEMPQDLRVKPVVDEIGKSNNRAGKVFEGLMPPPTVLVPYPIFLPVPIPIPIPIPLPVPKEKEKGVEMSSQTEDQIEEETCDKNGTKPLRKRKRIIDKKTKFVIKSKKILST